MKSFQELLERFQNGDARPDELARLEECLRADPAKRRQLVERTLFEVQLYKAVAVTVPDETVPSRRWRRVGRWQVLAVAAAILLLVGGAGIMWFWQGAGDNHQPFIRVTAGSLRTERGLGESPVLDETFEVVDAGPARFHLSDGSRMELQPASKALISRTSLGRPLIVLRAGGGRFQVAKGSEQFTVKTPAGSVTALGTEFTVRLLENQRQRIRLAVSVVSGKVRVVTKDENVVLAAGSRHDFNGADQHNNRDDGNQNTQDGQKGKRSRRSPQP